MDHHLVVLGRRARIDAVVERGLGQELQRVGLLLSHRRRFRGNVCGLSRRRVSALPLVQGLTGRRQGFQEERTGLGRQASADRHGTVFSWIHVEGPAGVLPGGLVPLRLAVHPSPAPDDALDVLGGAGTPDGEQALLGLRRRHPRERADLGVRQLAARERLGQPRQRGERARHAHLLAGRAQVETDAPRQPLGAGAKAVVPAAAGVKVADEIEEASAAASRCPESSAISSPRRSSSVVEACGAWTSMASPPSIEATLHRGFEATWEARHCAIAS